MYSKSLSLLCVRHLYMWHDLEYGHMVVNLTAYASYARNVQEPYYTQMASCTIHTMHLVLLLQHTFANEQGLAHYETLLSYLK